ncbi:hypothetical protein ABEB36_014877 [Hypothenemus hampei]|uniref:Uncharacterized protein n=1 Tax=Hypothenemus hampei TaxID=57062 RepID=A0ABD1E152_HYPHA
MFVFKIFFFIFILLTFSCNVLTADPDSNNETPLPAMFSEITSEYLKQCHEETGVSFEEVRQRHESHKEPSEQDLCFKKCLMTKSGILDENGKTNWDKIKEKIPDNLKNDMQTCLQKAEPIIECKDIENMKKCYRH